MAIQTGRVSSGIIKQAATRASTHTKYVGTMLLWHLAPRESRRYAEYLRNTHSNCHVHRCTNAPLLFRVSLFVGIGPSRAVGVSPLVRA